MDIQLIDNTALAERPTDDTAVPQTTTTTSTGSKLWSRPSIRAERKKRRYAKWQPERLGVANDRTESEQSSDERELIRAGTNTNTLTNASTIHESINGDQSDSRTPEQSGEQVQQQQQSQQQQDSGASTRTTHQSKNHPKICGLKPNTELDILYENQRGWFFFGIPLYSDRSLLNLDPAPWLNAVRKRSFVNITNAQVPDPSWEWAWKTWYVDMSGDVDEQGWQYSFSFGSSPWHGTHPFWHSFVRQRRWVRLRIKRTGNNRQSRTELEMAHRLTEDYFTIHSAVKSKSASMTGERASRPTSLNLTRNGVDEEEEMGLEEIKSIPALMYALKGAIVDREKLDAVKRFVDEGGPELYYLNGRIPEIMNRLVYQASRWQLLTYLKDTTSELSQKQQEQDSQPDEKVSEYLGRKQEYLSRAADTAERHLTSTEVLQEPAESNRESVPEMLDLTPGTKRDSLLSRFSDRFSFRPMDNGVSNVFADSTSGFGFRNRPGHTTTSLTDEPLLFLYPRWFSASSRQQARTVNRGVSVSRETTAPGISRARSILARARLRTQTATRGQIRVRTRSRIETLGALSRKRLLASKVEGGKATSTVANTTTTSAEFPTEAQTRAVDGKEQAPLIGEDGRFDPFVGLSGTDDVWLEQSSLKAPMWGFAARRRAARKRVVSQIRGVAKGLESSLEQNSLRDHAQEGPEQAADQDAAQGPPLEDKAEQQRRNILRHLTPLQRNRVLRREYHLKKLTSNERRSIYRTLKDLLERAERRGAAGSDLVVREVLAPDETVALIAGVSEKFPENENIFFVRLLNGCRVQVLSATESEGHYRKIILRGSDQATKTLENRFKRAQELQESGEPLIDVRKPTVPVYPSLQALKHKGIPKPLLRGVWASTTSSRPSMGLSVIMDQSGSVSTVRDFLEQTEAIIKSREERSKFKHSKRVCDALWSLFGNQQHLMSTAALNIAISYLLEHGFLGNAARLFRHAAYVATIDTFNIYLKSMAQRQNLVTFGRLLQRMILLRIQPNAHTWVTFLDCLISPSSKSNVVELMRKKGYLENPYIARKLLQSTIQELFMAHLKQGRSVDEFVNGIMTTAELNWFPAPLIKQMFSVTVQLKNVPATDRLLKFCLEGRLALTSQMIGEILRLFPRDTFKALNYTFQCLEAPRASLNALTYEQLFFHAFRNQHYNICRVLWRYACMERKTTNLMKNKLSFYLTQNVAPKAFSEQDSRWHTSAAKVIVGVDLHLPDYPMKAAFLRNVPYEFHDNPVGSIIHSGITEGEARETQRTAAKEILKHDVQFGAWYRPKYPLANMLEAAAELDADWQGVPRPTQWLVQNAIEVPVEPYKLW
ncbi:hypothetical protein BDV12DRAFT_182223 [Aspergillus spectabilis]